MPKLHGAVIREQGVTFAVALVKDRVINSRSQSDEMIQAVAHLLGCPLVVLMGETNRKVRGNRRDVVNFVASIDRRRIPWKEYRLSA